MKRTSLQLQTGHGSFDLGAGMVREKGAKRRFLPPTCWADPGLLINDLIHILTLAGG